MGGARKDLLRRVKNRTRPILDHLEKIRTDSRRSRYQPKWWNDIAKHAGIVATELARLRGKRKAKVFLPALELVRETINRCPDPMLSRRALSMVEEALKERGVDTRD